MRLLEGTYWWVCLTEMVNSFVLKIIFKKSNNKYNLRGQ